MNPKDHFQGKTKKYVNDTLDEIIRLCSRPRPLDKKEISEYIPFLFPHKMKIHYADSVEELEILTDNYSNQLRENMRDNILIVDNFGDMTVRAELNMTKRKTINKFIDKKTNRESILGSSFLKFGFSGRFLKNFEEKISILSYVLLHNQYRSTFTSLFTIRIMLEKCFLGDARARILLYFFLAGVQSITVVYQDIIFLRAPKKIRFDQQYRVHHDKKPALQFKEDKSYFLYGIIFRYDLWVTVTGNKLTKEDFKAVTNIEQRQAIIKYLGAKKIIKLLDMSLLDRSARGNELYGFTDRAINMRILKYVDPSTDRIYMSFVPRVITSTSPPNRREVDTADNAMAWKFSITFDEYKNLEIEA